jgi:hypothetical protein
MTRSIDPITTRGTTESFQYIDRRAPPLIDRGGEAQQVIPPISDRLEGNIMLDNAGDGRFRLTSRLIRSLEASKPSPQALAIEWASMNSTTAS